MYLRRSLVAVAALTLLVAASRAPAQDIEYLVGDVNADGVVTLSDVGALLGHLFQNVTISDCPAAGDANQDGAINLSDGIWLLHHLSHEGDDPPGTTPSTECNEYVSTDPLEDPGARLEVLSAVNNDHVGDATIRFGASNSRSLVGHRILFRIPGVKIGSHVGTGIDLTDSVDVTHFGDTELLGDSDTVQTLLLVTFSGPHAIPPSGTVRPFYEYRACIETGTPAGEYPIEILEAEFTDKATGRAIYPELVGGVLEVEDDVTETGDCSGQINADPTPGGGEPPPPNEPQCPAEPVGPTERAMNVTYEIADSTAIPGMPLDLSFSINADGGVQGFAFSADFDEEILTGTGGDYVWDMPGAGTDYAFSLIEFNNRNDVPGHHGIDEGYVIGAAVFCFETQVSLPANTDVHVGVFHFEVAKETPETVTQVRFLDGGRASGAPVHNSVVTDGETVLPEFLESFVTLDCDVLVLPVVDITTFFLRGDSSGNGLVNITDGLLSLSYLFLSGRAPTCFDAADANDDGELDVTDPIFTLNFLFLGTGGGMPAPYPEPGIDTTSDGMTCQNRT